MAALNNLFSIKTENGEEQKASLKDYLFLRDKIKARLLKFYSDITFSDAGLDSSTIKYYCTINGRLVIKEFNALEWLKIEKEGVFNEAYTEFIKRKNRTPFSFSKLLGSGDGKWRKKKSF